MLPCSRQPLIQLRLLWSAGPIQLQILKGFDENHSPERFKRICAIQRFCANQIIAAPLLQPDKPNDCNDAFPARSSQPPPRNHANDYGRRLKGDSMVVVWSPILSRSVMRSV